MTLPEKKTRAHIEDSDASYTGGKNALFFPSVFVHIFTHPAEEDSSGSDAHTVDVMCVSVCL